MNFLGKRFLVNALTFGRMPLVFLFMILAVIQAYQPETRPASVKWFAILATVSLILASVTDLFDGMLARKWNVVSKFGAMADPLMDKVFYLVVFPTLLWLLGRIPGETAHALVMLFFTVLYILRDQWVTFLRSVGSLFNADCSAKWLGKVRTATTFPCACLIYIYAALQPVWLPQGFIFALELVLVILTVWSMIDYTIQFLPDIKKSIE